MRSIRLLVAAVAITLAGSAATAHAQFNQSILLNDFYYDYEVYRHNPFIGSGLWQLVGTYDRRATAEAWAEGFSEAGWDVRIEPVYAPISVQPYRPAPNLYFRRP